MSSVHEPGGRLSFADQGKRASRTARFGWALLGSIGYLLSPLSWWNDLYVNLPLAYLLASVSCAVDTKYFLPVLTVGYWLTNVLGLVLLQAGVARATLGRVVRMTWSEVIKWLLFSLLYTGMVVLLVLAGILKPLHEWL